MPHFVRSMVGMDRAAAQEAFSEFLSNRSLTTQQIRFIEMIIDQLTARGVMEPSALYEAPFSNVHAGGPEALFAGKDSVIDGIFEKLKTLQPAPMASTGLDTDLGVADQLAGSGLATLACSARVRNSASVPQSMIQSPTSARRFGSVTPSIRAERRCAARPPNFRPACRHSRARSSARA